MDDLEALKRRLAFAEKHIELLHKYRQCLNLFDHNCKCGINNGVKLLYNYIERDYAALVNSYHTSDAVHNGVDSSRYVVIEWPEVEASSLRDSDANKADALKSESNASADAIEEGLAKTDDSQQSVSSMRNNNNNEIEMVVIDKECNDMKDESTDSNTDSTDEEEENIVSNVENSNKNDATTDVINDVKREDQSFGEITDVKQVSGDSDGGVFQSITSDNNSELTDAVGVEESKSVVDRDVSKLIEFNSGHRVCDSRGITATDDEYKVEIKYITANEDEVNVKNEEICNNSDISQAKGNNESTTLETNDDPYGVIFESIPAIKREINSINSIDKSKLDELNAFAADKESVESVSSVVSSEDSDRRVLRSDRSDKSEKNERREKREKEAKEVISDSEKQDLKSDNPHKEKRRKSNAKIVELIKSGKIEAHLIEVRNESVLSERHRVFMGGSKPKNDDLKHVPLFGPIDDNEQQEEIYNYCLDLFNRHFNADESENERALPYVLEVWVPEAIVRAIYRVRKCKLKDAETAFLKGVILSKAEMDEYIKETEETPKKKLKTTK